MTNPPPLVPFEITICGLGELRGHAEAGFSHVASILDPDFPDPTDFRAYRPHRRVVWRFDDVIAEKPDVIAPQVADVEAILAWSDVLADEAAVHVLIHCHAGVSRSTATAIILMAARHPGREADAFAHLARIRPRSWPNTRMLAIADDLLGRQGAFVGALTEHQRRVAEAYPDFADMLRGTDRAHEVLGL